MLICPECQQAANWAADLDSCQACGSIHLVRRLGEVECRDCGAIGQQAAAASHGGDVAEPSAEDLAAEVDRALAKVLGPSRQRPPYAMS